jgi:hypothetical protein
MVFKANSGQLGPVLGVIVLLEENSGGVLVIIAKALLEFIFQDFGIEFPSILHANPTPSHSMQSHTITEPPPNFRVPSTSLSLKPSPAFFQAHFLSSDPSLLILVY